MTTDWVARCIAIAGVVLASLSLGWAIFAWRRQGPALKLKAKCTGRGPLMAVVGSVTNVGHSDALLDKVTFSWTIPIPNGYKTLKADVGGRYIIGLTPDHLLPAERRVEFHITNLADIDPGLDAAMHDQRDAKLTFLTVTGRKGRGKIKYEGKSWRQQLH